MSESKYGGMGVRVGIKEDGGVVSGSEYWRMGVRVRLWVSGMLQGVKIQKQCYASQGKKSHPFAILMSSVLWGFRGGVGWGGG